MIAIPHDIALAHKIYDREGKQHHTLLDLLAHRRALATEKLIGTKCLALADWAYKQLAIEIDRFSDRTNRHQFKRKVLQDVVGRAKLHACLQRACGHRQLGSRNRRRRLSWLSFGSLEHDEDHRGGAERQHQTKREKHPSFATTHGRTSLLE